MTKAEPIPGHGGSPSIAAPDYWWYVARADLLEAALRSYVEGAGLALDLGSADSPSAAWLRDAAERTVSLDIDPRGLGAGGVCGSALSLPFEDAAFDVGLRLRRHRALRPRAGRHRRGVARPAPGGRFVMSVPAYSWAWTDFDVANGHHRRYTRGRAVAAVQRAGFRVDRATYGFATVFPMFVAERVVRKLARRTSNGPVDVVELPHVPKPLNSALLGLSRVDRAVLGRSDLPFGSSVFLAATRVA